MNSNPVVLITGCSSGIGKELSYILSKKDYIVVASARKMNTLEEIEASLKVEIDVTNPATIKKAMDQIMEKYGRIDILINNAGYSTRGALEEVGFVEVHQMFEVNVFGILNMIQAVIPLMRKAQTGKVIHIGSISGTFSQGLNGGYCASKFAVEAINDALRLEGHPFKIQSTVIEPGPIDTNFFKTLEKNAGSLMSNQDSPYYKFYSQDIEYRQKQKKTSSKKAAEAIGRIIEKEKLKSRYTVAVPFSVKIVSALPDRIKEWFLLHH